jgi:SWI/SNF-related matrix-associated actin-dependent regulator 1 of chromatin subfamily A
MRVLEEISDRAALSMSIEPPFPHQLDGVAFALNPARNASLLAHDTGCGKTRTGIMIMDEIAAQRALVVCPDLAKYAWRDQIERWARSPRYVTIIKDTRTPIASLFGVVIVTYDQLSINAKLVRALKAAPWDLLIADEAHALKTADSKRTIAMYGMGCKGTGLAASATRIVLLTATPMLGHPGDLWTHLRALTPDLLPVIGLDSFQDRYCESKTIWRGHQQFLHMTGARLGAPAKELNGILLKFMHRVRKRDVQKDLPPLLWTMVAIHIADLAVPRFLLSEWRTAEAALARDISVKTGDDLLAVARASPHSATQRRLTGLIKLKPAIEAIRAELNGSSEKVVVYAFHQKVIEGLAQGLVGYGAVTIYGDTPKEVRYELVRKFQTDPLIRVFVGQMMIASEAIELTAASSVWFVECDWTPKTMHQAASRPHRYGQHNPVNARILALEGSIDAGIARVLERKVKSIEAVVEPDNAGPPKKRSRSLGRSCNSSSGTRPRTAPSDQNARDQPASGPGDLGPEGKVKKMPVHISISIDAENAADLISQLQLVGSRFFGAERLSVPAVSGVVSQRQTEEQGKDAGEVEAQASEQPKRRGKRAQAEAAEENYDRAKIIEDLTQIFMSGDPVIRDKITSWRDAQGVARLRDLKDDAIPDAMKLLAELQAAQAQVRL